MTDNIKPKLLLVDDEAVILNTLKRLFHKDYDVVCFEDPKASLEFLHSNHVHIIISDMRMPQMNGAEFLCQARAIQPQAVRFLLTGFSDLSSTIDAINNGGEQAYISKPWDNEALKNMVAQAAKSYLLEQKNTKLNQQLQKQNQQLSNFNQTLELKVYKRTNDLKDVIGRLKKSINKQRKSLQEMIDLLCLIIEEHNPSEYRSSKRVALQCRIIMQNFVNNDKNTEKQVNHMYLAALMHNLGKITLPKELLLIDQKQITREQLQQYKQHAINGAELLANIPSLKAVANIIKSQYEHYGGGGFPCEHKGEDILLGARILRVVDDYDKLVQGKGSLKMLSPAEALSYIEKHVDNYYDSKVVDCFKQYIINLPSDSDHCLSIDMLNEGMVLSEDINSPNQGILLTKGTKLTTKIINNLSRLETKYQYNLYAFIEGEKRIKLAS